MAYCSVSPNQEHASAVPGNIGIVKATVEVWDHDPLLGRAHQQTSFPFSEQTAEQIKQESPNASFEINSCFLKPVFQAHDMWIATKKPTDIYDQTEPLEPGEPAIRGRRQFKLDYVPCEAGKSRLPGGEIYNLNENPDANGKVEPNTGKDIFFHQTWIHAGSLLKKSVPVHPSEYNINLADIKNAENLVRRRNEGEGANSSEYFGKFTITELQSAPKWEMREAADGTTGTKSFIPLMISKQVPSGTDPVHWTLEKLTPVWQGQDFFLNVRLGDQNLDIAVDPQSSSEVVDTDTNQYKYLIYNPDRPPSSPPGDDKAGWVEGISNEAFYIEPKHEITGFRSLPFGGPSVTTRKNYAAGREKYWWRYKSYLLIEIGYGHPDHNYFIEIVKGRNPRFLHLGEEWDNIKRLETGEESTSKDFKYIRKCRVLSEFRHVSSDELFKKKEFKISIRNHLGRMVVSFEGYESRLWVINRLDNDPTRFDFKKILIPMVVPPAKLRIHGGNLSCALSYAPTKYTPSADISFKDRQADTYGAKNEDLYMTFANIGNSEKHVNDQIHRRIFKERRFLYRKIGYDLDCYETYEMLKNAVRKVPIYEIFNKQYKKIGRGYVSARPSETPGPDGILPPQEIRSGVDKKNPHRARIFNGQSANKPFKFGLKEESDSSYPYKEYASRWDVGLKLEAGTVRVPRFEDANIIPADASLGEAKLFKNFLTPIITNWTLVLLGGAKPFEGKVEPFDIAPLVTSINDSWSAEGFTTINHEMQIRCYIPDSFLPIVESKEGQIDPNLHALGQRLLKLHKQSFYVTVSYWWEDGVGERDAPGNIYRRKGPPRSSKLLVQMSGVAYGAELEKSVNKLYMNFSIKDYSSILDKGFIFNSPFFDGVSDALAVYELARMAGFDDEMVRKLGIDRRPLGFLQKVLTDPNIPKCKSFRYNGEECIYRSYDLPGSYAELANPSVRFQNGETYWSAIVKIAQLASKVVYFDRWGVLKFENSPAIEAAFNSGERELYTPKFSFVTSPFRVTAGGGEGETSQDRFVFNPNEHVSHLVWEVVRYSRSVEDCVNQILLFTASTDVVTEDGETQEGFIIEGYTFFEQIHDPSAEGFLGFRKTFYQSNGVFGGLEGVRIGLQHYAKMKYPPAQISFQTYGVPGLKPLDIIALDDNLFYITEISHEIDPSTNRWWMNVTGEWLKPFLGDLGFLSERGSNDSGSENDNGGGA